MNPYEVLGVREGASEAEIKAAYKELVKNIELCAKGLRTIGVRDGDKVTIAMPNAPQAISPLCPPGLRCSSCIAIPRSGWWR